MVAHLTIGTADSRINLLNANGFMLRDWGVGGTEYGTIFQESQIADYRQMAAYRDLTVMDTFNLVLNASGQDEAARQVQALRSMIRMALDFWSTTYQYEVVYLAAQASCETNMRYAVVYDARLVGESSPFGQPFLQPGNGTVMDTLSLIIERGAWTANAPGTGTGVEIGVTQTYDGRTVGNVDDTGTATPTTNARTVFVANKHNVAQLTDIWWWNVDAAAWCLANLMDAAVPFAFLPPAPLQVGDFVIFGIDSSVADSGPFCSLIFDIGTALTAGGGITIQWIYSDSLAGVNPNTWAALTVQDNTNDAGAMTGDAFNTTGINSVHWQQLDTGWQALNPNPGAALGVTAYWVGARVTAAAGAPTPPTQANRDIYTVTWPYIEFDEDEVDGDMPALLRMSVDSRSAQDGAGTTTDLWCQRVVAGLRSYDRGANFTSYINLADEQNNADIQITVNAPDTSFATNTTSPSGRIAYYAPGALRAMAEEIFVRVTPDFYGRYHAFVRAYQFLGNAGDIGVRLAYAPLGSYVPEKRTVTRYFLQILDDQLLDFGEIVLGPYTDTYPLEVSHTFIWIECSCTNAVAEARFYDLILIPVDEWAVDSEDMLKNADDVGYTNDYWSHLEVDGIRNQRTVLSYLIGTTSGRIARYWRPIVNGLPILQTSKQQRLWFLHARNDDYADVDDVRGDPEICSSIQIWKQQRYSTLRGDQ